MRARRRPASASTIAHTATSGIANAAPGCMPSTTPESASSAVVIDLGRDYLLVART